MNKIKRFSPGIALSVLLLCCNLAVAADIQDANRLFKQGLTLTEQGKTAEAIKVFTSLTEDYPELPEPYNNLAVLYAGQGQYEKAKVALEMAIRTHPSYATAHENLGDIYAKMASQAYDRALQLDKSNTSTATKLEMIKELFGGNAHKSANASPTSPTIISGSGTLPPSDNTKSVVIAVAPEVPKPAISTKPSLNTSEDPLKTVQDWAAAWSSKNSKKYLAFYAKEFKTPDGESRGAWEKHRQERIAAPKSIHVEVKEAKVKIADANHAIVSFRQFYRASHLHTASSKTLTLIKSNDKWLIVEEHTGK
jgi:tetratricopeptide (TPR) repeat protein